MTVPGLGGSGGVRTLVEWANRWSHELGAVTLYTPFGGPLADAVDERVRIVQPAAGPSLALKALWRGSGPGHYEPELMRAQQAAARRVLRGATGTPVAGFPPWFADGSRPWTRYCQHLESLWFGSNRAKAASDRLCFGGMGPVLVNSSWLAEQARGLGADDARLRLVFPGVNHDVFHPATGARERRDRARVVSLGRWDVSWKGTQDLLDACELAARTAPAFDLLLFGDKTRPRQETAWGSVTELGFVTHEQLADLYRDADVVVNPSWHESFPLPPLEAMACGTAVVSTDIGVSDYCWDRTTALVVPAHDATALATALSALLTDAGLRHELAEAAATTAQSFTWASGFQQFVDAVRPAS